MNEGTIHKGVLVFALLGTLLVRLLAWGGTGDGTARAGHPNQTIPTPTPSGQPVTSPTIAPTKPGPTHEVTQLPTRPPDTPTLALTPSPSSTLTGRPTDGTATATIRATATQPVSSTPTPTRQSGTPLPTPTAVPSDAESATPAPRPPAESLTSLPGEPSPTPALLATQEPPMVGTVTPASSGPVQTWTPTATLSSTSGVAATLFNSSCLWLVVGLLLIGGGLVILVRWWHSA